MKSSLQKHSPLLASAFSALYLTGLAGAESVPISSLDLRHMTTGWSDAKIDQSVIRNPIRIGGEGFEKGVGTHANSRFRVDLGAKATRFTAKVGISDESSSKGSVTFIVRGDLKEIWRSDQIRHGDAPVPVDLDLTGIKQLTLIVNDGGDGSSDDHAVWADAMIAMEPGAPDPVALPPYESIRVGSRNFSLDFTVGDDGRLYQAPLGGGSLDPSKRVHEAYPQWGDGYIYEPALQITHHDGNTSTSLLFKKSSRIEEAEGRVLHKIHLHDPAYQLDVDLLFRVHEKSDVIEQWTEISHQQGGEIRLERMASSSLNLHPSDVRMTQFQGDWAMEMQPFTEVLGPGTKVIDSKIGVRAHQFRNPSFLLSFDGSGSEESGRVLAGTLAWSGSFQFAFDHTGTTLRALCGVNPFASAYHLKPDQTFTTPAMIWTWSDAGMGEMSHKLHDWARDHGVRDGHGDRRIVLNNWEATGFDFDFDRIVGLYDPGVAMGAEIFLLDDGWFGNKHPRLSDNAGLGDWEPNRKRLPDGLEPLAKEAIDRGIDFGIWIEPEMVNPRSELFEKNPDWIISQKNRELELQRNQLVLDITRPEVWDFQWKVVDDALGVPGVSFCKWDCNRYLTQAGSSWLPADRQSHLWIDYNLALYRLMEKTAKVYPDITMMLCSGGGGRVDYGALRYFDEFWPSDNTDPVARVPMQWNYSYFFPAIAIASHVTHMGNRPMHFSCAVAMSGRFGMDLDVANLTADEFAVCKGAVLAYKSIRNIVLHGDLHRLENPHSAYRGALNYVTQNQKQAVLFTYQLEDGPAAPVRPRGLDPDGRYTIRELNPAPGRPAIPMEGRTLTGAEIMKSGLIPSCSKSVEACVILLCTESPTS
ncbi:MAG: alpha-galactosidase [Akkermansiaceae bacterium]|jgi:alpha-galactosidase|nr:alpha-galactosidase [Akkermansiaceae bacterium]